LLAECYEIATRYGQRSWSYQFGHQSLTNAFEVGHWDALMDEIVALDAPGFYAAWRMLEQAEREAYRGQLDDARTKLERAKELAGTDSTQGVSGIAAVEASINLAAGDLEAVLPAARVAWAHEDSTDSAVARALAAASAANNVDWMREAHLALSRIERHGRQADGMRAGTAAGLAMLEGRRADARALYIAASRDLAKAHSFLWLALLNLSVGTRGAGRIPESADALAAAEAFFRGVGAESFLDRYRAAYVPGPSDETREPAVERPTEVKAT
jgi:hypothetical protein